MKEQEPVDFAELVDFVEEKLNAERRAIVAAAVAASPEIQAQVAWLREFARPDRRLVLVDPPPTLQTQLRSAFRNRMHHAPSPDAATARELPDLGAAVGNWWRRVVATLSVDSGMTPLAAGVRGAGNTSRQLFYRTAEVDIVLSVVAAAGSAPNRFEVHGQILPGNAPAGDAAAEESAVEESTADFPLYAAQLLNDGREVALTNSDEIGEFYFSELLPAEYELVLSGRREEIVLESVPITF